MFASFCDIFTPTERENHLIINQNFQWIKKLNEIKEMNYVFDSQWNGVNEHKVNSRNVPETSSSSSPSSNTIVLFTRTRVKITWK